MAEICNIIATLLICYCAITILAKYTSLVKAEKTAVEGPTNTYNLLEYS